MCFLSFIPGYLLVKFISHTGCGGSSSSGQPFPNNSRTVLPYEDQQSVGRAKGSCGVSVAMDDVDLNGSNEVKIRLQSR